MTEEKLTARSIKDRPGWVNCICRKGIFSVIVFLLGFLFVGSFSSDVYATINESINFQGKLVASNGTNISDGSYYFKLTFYNAATGGSVQGTASEYKYSGTLNTVADTSITYTGDTDEGTLQAGMVLWNTTDGDYAIIESVNTGTNTITLDRDVDTSPYGWANSESITTRAQVSDGVFNLKVVGLGGLTFDTDDLYLQVEFDDTTGGGDTLNETFSPRKRLNAVPYAFRAKYADVSGDNYWQQSGTVVSPATGGDDLRLGTNEQLQFGSTGQITFEYAAATLSVTQSNDDINFDSNTLFIDGSADRIGIGTNSPDYTLQVDGDIVSETDSTDNLGNSAIYWANSYIDRMYVNATAYIDGGTAGDLTITGDLMPSADDTYDLGSSTARWQDLYLGPDSLHIGTNGDEGIVGYNTTSNSFEFDSNGDGTYEFAFGATGLTANADILVDADGSTTTGRGTRTSISDGQALVSVESADNLCTNSLTKPTFVYTDSGGDCDATDGDTHTYVIGSGGTASDTAVGSTWAFWDTETSVGDDDGIYDRGEDLYIDKGETAEYDLATLGTDEQFWTGIYADTFYGKSTTISSFDLAEDYKAVDESITAGEVVILAEGSDITIDKSQERYQSEVIGVVSTKPGLKLSDWEASEEEQLTMRPVALAGRVPVKVTTENGDIEKGDMLVSASRPGYAMKACGDTYCEAGIVVGKALEGFSHDEEGDSPEVLEKLEESQGEIEEAAGDLVESVDGNGEDLVGAIEEILEELTEPLPDSETEEGEGRIMMFVNLIWYDPEKDESSSLNESLAQLQDLFDAFESRGWGLSGDLLTTPMDVVASSFTATSGTFSILKTEVITVGDNKFMVDSSGNVDMAGDLVIAGFISGRYGDLMIKLGDDEGEDRFIIANSEEEEVFSVDSLGGMRIFDDENATTGFGMIEAGEKSVTVETTQVRDKPKIYITFNGDYFPATRFWVENMEEGESFDVVLNTETDEDVAFTWWVINSVEVPEEGSEF